MQKEETNQNLFSYGTLRMRAVQVETFGRLLEGHEDRLSGFKLSMVEIDNPDVVEVSGDAVHPIIAPTEDTQDFVEGTVFKITTVELMQADRYEVDAYKRVEVTLDSGEKAWAYIDARCCKEERMKA
mgnify:FL=1